MTETARNMFLQRITLAVDAGGYSLANIELAVQLAMAFKAQLQGLFIEDTDLLQIADLPFSTEITLSTAQERSIDALSMQRSLRVKSLEFRDILAVTAEKSQVEWSFTSVQGRKIETGLSGIEDSELMIVGQALSRSRSLSAKEDKKRIILFYDETTDLLQVLESVLNLSAERNIELLLVGTDKDSSASLQQLLEKRLKENPNLVLSHLDEIELQRMLKEKMLTTDYAIASRRNSSDVLRWMIENSICPIILLA